MTFTKCPDIPLGPTYKSRAYFSRRITSPSNPHFKPFEGVCGGGMVRADLSLAAHEEFDMIRQTNSAKSSITVDRSNLIEAVSPL